ncbi:hypothetical protein [Ferroplasma sp.]|uniref:hypothetical protein n=1 Tax=Ferroplasma sp. TaxID=2591003 RepID=UPI002636D815|nr:hypothetical protein [Ferroplasma sp.]
MRKVKINILIISFLLCINSNILCAQTDSTKKRYSGFIELTGGVGTFNIYSQYFGTMDVPHAFGFTGAIPYKHSNLGFIASISYKRGNYNINSVTSLGTGWEVYFPGVDYNSELNILTGIFCQENIPHLKSFFYIGLLFGIVNLQIPENGWSDTAGGWSAFPGPPYEALDVYKINTTAFCGNIKIGLKVHIIKKLFAGIDFDLLYSNLNNGLKIYSTETTHVGWYVRNPPYIITTNNEYTQSSLIDLNLQISIGYNID